MAGPGLPAEALASAGAGPRRQGTARGLGLRAGDYASSTSATGATLRKEVDIESQHRGTGVDGRGGEPDVVGWQRMPCSSTANTSP